MEVRIHIASGNKDILGTHVKGEENEWKWED